MKVLTFGTFDHLHPGHIAYLSEAAGMGDLTIIVARDRNVEHIKGAAPQGLEQDRLLALEEVFPDATVVLGDSEDYLRPVRDAAPDVIVMGYDQKLPPGVTEDDLPCPVQRAGAYNPEEFKSSLRRENS
ncbi:adenylyltransferase/cytidyltransferase family protein [Candidatus Peregrinibacteria bacterium]|jgi:FAD synthetase|nr:adenylyltransferase/cytidyltransferase family protein [Candidatus Peregrinibacteria bacterium]MBT5468545.1 adenylyltransferase/cytidyltransferase family protein [Candidatus Peregrinibacteria bacterium]MBT7337469.1 adenylyltransferase/cytidyltransferase family protein [Candidatus Peregrinibacteria bacterium]MBT7494749.1 adenylyltransferase/cytidyltransferase family protein [Candidatus Peribacter sp.]